MTRDVTERDVIILQEISIIYLKIYEFYEFNLIYLCYRGGTKRHNINELYFTISYTNNNNNIVSVKKFILKDSCFIKENI